MRSKQAEQTQGRSGLITTLISIGVAIPMGYGWVFMFLYNHGILHGVYGFWSNLGDIFAALIYFVGFVPLPIAVAAAIANGVRRKVRWVLRVLPLTMLVVDVCSWLYIVKNPGGHL